MITYKYYKFPNKISVPAKDKWPSNVSYFEVGLISNNDAVYNAYGQEVRPQTYKSGWHVNVCYRGDADLSFISEYEVAVQTPSCIWMGQQTQTQ